MVISLGGALFGNPAQLVDPRILAGTDGREAWLAVTPEFGG